MKTVTAAQKRFFENAVQIAATHLLFDAMRRQFSCPKLADIVTIHNGQGLRANQREETGQHTVYAAGGPAGRHSARLSDRPFVVIGRKGSAGKPTFAPSGGWVIDTAYFAQPKDEYLLNCEFLFHSISSLDFTDDVISTAIPGINRTSIYRHTIPLPPRPIQDACVKFLNATAANQTGDLPPLPCPLDEQRRIVARIEALAAKIEDVRTLRSDTSRKADGLIASKEMAIWPESALKTATTLGEVTSYLARGRQSEQGNSDHYLIKTQHVQLGRYVPTQMTLAPHVESKINPDAIVQTNDVLIACSAAGCLGRVAFYKGGAKKVSTDTHVAIARAKEGVILPDYLYSYLKGAQGQFQLRSREKGDWQREKISFRLTELNVADMRKVPIPIPPLHEQRRIVAYLDALQAKVDALKKLQAETAAELDVLLPSILDRAFRGEL